MNLSRVHKVLIPAVLGIATIASSFSASSFSVAAEPAAKFLDELRAAGYYDMALLYLEQARTNPRIDESWKQEISYEQGLTLLESATTIGNRDLRFQRFDEAQQKIKQFVSENPDHPKAIGANAKLADALVRRGASLVYEANKASAVARKPALLKEARGYYKQAEQMYLDTEKALFAKLNDKKLFPTVIPPGQLFDERKALQEQVINAKFYGAARVVYLLASTVDPESDERKQFLIAAAEKYQKLGEVFRVRGMWGLYARQREGVCFQEAEEHKKALAAFNLIMLQADEPPPLMNLKIQTLPFVLRSWVALKDFVKAIEAGEKYMRTFRGRAVAQPKALELRYALALAYVAKAAEEGPPKNERSLLEASKLALEGKKHPGARRKGFIKILRDMGKPVEDVVDDGPPTFARLMEQAGEARQRWQKAIRDVEAAKKDNPDAVAGLQEKVAEEKNKVLVRYNHALRSVDAETTDTQIRYAQTALAYTHLVSNEFYEAAVIGEFVARNYPGSASAEAAANYAMIAYQQMYYAENRANPTTDKAFETSHVVDMALYIIERWPTSRQARKAFDALIGFSIAQDKLDEAVEFLEKVDEGNPARATAEIKIGQAYWAKFRRQRALEPAGRPSKEELDSLLQKAKTLLTDGISRLGAMSSVDEKIASAVLSLSKIHLDTGESDASIALLENETFGALKLIEAKHEAAANPKFVTSAYKLALRAYITAKQPEFKKAEAVLDKLEALTKDDPDGAQKLTNILIGIAYDLKKMIDLLTDDKQAERARIMEGFELFLVRVAARDGGDMDFAVYNWMAGTWFSLAEGGQGDRIKPNEDDLRRYGEAIKAYETILSKAVQFKLTDKNILSIKYRLAMCYKKIGKYDKAIDLLLEVLQKKAVLSLQVEAARVYQERAEAGDGPDHFRRAIGGAKRDPKTRRKMIWGWNSLSEKTARLRKNKPAYNKVFHTARYNAAKCFLGYAKTQQGAVRTTYLDKAKRSLASTLSHAPEMGGKDWKAKYDRLHQEIDNAR